MGKRLGELLVASGAARTEDVAAALKRQGAGDQRRLGQILLASEAVNPTGLAQALGQLHHVPFTHVKDVDAGAGSLLSPDFLAENRMVPFKLETGGELERIHLAVEDPGEFALVDELRFQLHRAVTVYVAPVDEIHQAIDAIRQGRHLIPPLQASESEVEAELSLEMEIVEDDAEEPGLAVIAGVELTEEEGTGGEKDAPKNVLRDAPPVDAFFDLPASSTAESPASGVNPPDATNETSKLPLATEAAADSVSETVTSSVQVAESAANSIPDTAAPDETQSVAEPRPMSSEPLSASTSNGSAASGAAPLAPSSTPTEPLAFTEADLAILDAIERLADGEEPVLETEKVKPARMVAALTRLLMKKGLIDEHEFLDELSRK